MTEILLFAALVSAAIAVCLAFMESDERADARRRNQAHRVRR